MTNEVVIQTLTDKVNFINEEVKRTGNNLADLIVCIDAEVLVHALSFVNHLQSENAELQKRVNELAYRLAEKSIATEGINVTSTDISLYLHEKLLEQAVKDTAKEILTKMLANVKRLKEQFNSTTYGTNREHLIATIEIEIEGIKNLAKHYGAEVE